MGCLEVPALPRPPLLLFTLLPDSLPQDLSSQCPKEEPLPPAWVTVYLCPLGTRHGARSLECIISFKPLNNTVRYVLLSLL